MKEACSVAVEMLPPTKFHDTGFVEILILLRRQRGSVLCHSSERTLPIEESELRAIDDDGLSLRRYAITPVCLDTTMNRTGCRQSGQTGPRAQGPPAHPPMP